MSSAFPVIIGPTAGGKSELAVEVALRLSGEVISADAFQVYRGMDIGTGKIPPGDRRGVPHHLIDIRDPTEPFTVDDWLRLAENAIAEIRARSRTPVVVGGTHLYIKALLEGLFEGPAPDPGLRARLQAMSPDSRRADLQRFDPEAAARIHPNDERRTIRALEVFHATGAPISRLQSQWDQGTRRADALVFGLEWSTEAINRRINARVAHMAKHGLVEEASALWESARLGPQAREALGYKQLIRHFEGECTLEEALEQTKIETRRFAKSQRTWLRRLLAPPPPPKSAESRDTSAGPSARDEHPGRPVTLDAERLTAAECAQTIVETVLTA